MDISGGFVYQCLGQCISFERNAGKRIMEEIRRGKNVQNLNLFLRLDSIVPFLLIDIVYS